MIIMISEILHVTNSDQKPFFIFENNQAGQLTDNSTYVNACMYAGLYVHVLK